MNETVFLAVLVAWLGIIVFLSRRGVPLWQVILAASVGIGLALGRGFSGLASDSLAVMADPTVLDLLAMVTLIYLYSFLLKATHRMKQIASYLNWKMRDPRWVLVSVPAIVGLIPMPGGAMFTAPITDEVGDRISLTPEYKVFTNYWFRHCWELAFPLYPGIILAAGLIRITPTAFSWILMPLSLAAFIGGGLVFFLGYRREAAAFLAQSSTDDRVRHALSVRVLWPILAVILVALVRIPVTIGLLGIILFFSISERLTLKRLWIFFLRSFNWPIILLIWAVFFFGKVLTSTGLLQVVGTAMVRFGTPPWLLTFLLPFFMGMLTGVTPGFVGTVFPILLPFWKDSPELWLQLAYAGGVAGVFLSPAHLCLSMTQEYFKARLFPIIRIMFLPVAVVTATAILRFVF